MNFVEVAVDRPIRTLFTYRVPHGLQLELGHVVQVPFGRQKLTGYVIRSTKESAFENTKSILRLLDPIPAFDETQLPFFEWIARYYLAGLGEVIATALPSRIKARIRRVYIPTDAGIEALATGDLEPEDSATLVLREIVARPSRTRKGIQRGLSDEVDESHISRAIDFLIKHQWVAIEERESGTRAGRITTVKLVVSPESIPIEGGVRMRGVLARLAEAAGQLDMSTLVQLEGAGARDAVRRLESKGLVVVADREDRDAAFSSELPDAGSAKTLNLLAVAHNYERQGKTVRVLKPSFDTRFGAEQVTSRAGLTRDAHRVIEASTVLEPGEFEGCHCVLVDEAQFLTPQHVDQLRDITRRARVPVICYGLRTDFRTQLFPGSRRLLELADAIEEVKTTCHFCNRKAVVNLKHLGGKATIEGPVVDLGAEEKYYPSCYPCYTQQLEEAHESQYEALLV